MLLACSVFLFAEGSAEEIKIGVMYSLTGAGAPVGTTQLDGANLAIKQANEKGGVLINGERVKVKLIVRDDETKPDVAIP